MGYAGPEQQMVQEVVKEVTQVVVEPDGTPIWLKTLAIIVPVLGSVIVAIIVNRRRKR